ncbi:uncharacterized protein LOC143248531 [Tachypleus tridentatus]|uniref:uncharacterized protein LOC143248531 n=1 Tax=Tachypleus tridentatus TaxID=6853 RepID=UPI003FD0B30C
MPVSSEEESSEESICGSGSAERRKTVGGNSEEKLAKDFSNLYDLISEELLKHGQVANGVVPELKNGSTESLISECSLSCETDSLASTYKKCLKSLQFESWPMETEGSNSHHFANHYRKCGAGPPNQILRIAQELTSLHSSLPLELSSSIFVRTDDEKSCFLRALITGPEGTPYSNGCFFCLTFIFLMNFQIILQWSIFRQLVVELSDLIQTCTRMDGFVCHFLTPGEDSQKNTGIAHQLFYRF